MNAREVQMYDPDQIAKMAKAAAERLKQSQKQDYNQYSTLKRQHKGLKRDFKQMLKDAKGKGVDKAIEVLTKIKNQKSFDRSKLSNKGWRFNTALKISNVFQKIKDQMKTERMGITSKPKIKR